MEARKFLDLYDVAAARADTVEDLQVGVALRRSKKKASGSGIRNCAAFLARRFALRHSSPLLTPLLTSFSLEPKCRGTGTPLSRLYKMQVTVSLDEDLGAVDVWKVRVCRRVVRTVSEMRKGEVGEEEGETGGWLPL